MRNRSGSALLVVLGMLAFMVISGLAFAVFMRSTRMSSSFTRRTSATRQLAKAALAEAIDQIDRAIANDPHPNVRLGNSNENNYWIGRVLVTTDTSSGTKQLPAQVISDIGSNPADGGCQETVPVLSLEALAYLPPCLVNEARYYGQRTPTAAWQSLSFDAGRYAFIALDVSDYFDVNRILFDEARSSKPARRVNCTYLIEGGDDHATAPSGASALETFLSKYRKPDDNTGEITFPTVPFVSLADFNLALGAGTAGFASPVYKYLQSPGDTFYGCAPGSTAWDAYSRMTFVTDSLAAPETTAATKTFDLDSEKGQPYSLATLRADQAQRTVGRIMTDAYAQNKDAKYEIERRVSECGLVALCDYLDRDSVPTSLAIPTTERVPMVCAFRPNLSGLKVEVKSVVDEEKLDQSAGEGQPHYDQRTVSVRYLAKGGVLVDAWTAYPFRDFAGQDDTFKADCRMAAFLSSEEMGLRTSKLGSKTDVLRRPDVKQDKFESGVAWLYKAGTTVSATAPKTQKEAIGTVSFNFNQIGSVFPGGDGAKLLTITYRWDRVYDEEQEKWIQQTPTLQNCKVVGTAKSELSPLTADGAANADFTKQIQNVRDGATLDSIALAAEMRFNLAFWIAIRNSNDKVVDLVPACMIDDKDYNQINNNWSQLSVGGSTYPLMKFSDSSGVLFTLDKNCLLGESKLCDRTVELAQKAVAVRDPRYNYAPENWYASDGTISADRWLQDCGCTDAGCDGDIFMATSDQSKLQSITELAFIPRFGTLKNEVANPYAGDHVLNPDKGRTDKVFLARGNEVEGASMWKTFNPFDNGDNADGFEDLIGMFRHNGNGLRVNPYSDSTNVVMAAFANTPVSWRVASDNEQDNPAAQDGCQADAADFNGEHAWSAYNSKGFKVAWEDLEDVAGNFMARVRSYAVNGESWEPALMDLFTDNAGKGSKNLCGVDLADDEMFLADKKTLWGFWQDSFAARQQLFLVFVRSEPMLLGGGIAGVTPPQLGAKAMAVVWRNPNKTNGSQNNNNNNSSGYIPHQTRVLFYRQFE